MPKFFHSLVGKNVNFDFDIKCCQKGEITPEITKTVISREESKPLSEWNKKQFAHCNMLYEVTITLKPYLYHLDQDGQYKKTANDVRDMFSPQRYRVSAICELTKDFNIHYHLLVSEVEKSKNPPLGISNILRKYKWMGRRSVDQVCYVQSYVEYLKKDLKKTGDIIKGCPRIRDDYDILSETSIEKLCEA